MQGRTGNKARDATRRPAAMTGPGFRLDIQGVCGFALVLVLGTHAGLTIIPGGFVGLDAFYVLSGFLITGLILAEVRNTGRISLTRFYAPVDRRRRCRLKVTERKGHRP